MKQQVDVYKNNGKIEAANRYQDQINLLQVSFINKNFYELLKYF